MAEGQERMCLGLPHHETAKLSSGLLTLRLLLREKYSALLVQPLIIMTLVTAAEPILTLQITQPAVTEI